MLLSDLFVSSCHLQEDTSPESDIPPPPNSSPPGRLQLSPGWWPRGRSSLSQMLHENRQLFSESFRKFSFLLHTMHLALPSMLLVLPSMHLAL